MLEVFNKPKINCAKRNEKRQAIDDLVVTQIIFLALQIVHSLPFLLYTGHRAHIAVS
jgi:hypothetical protein